MIARGDTYEKIREQIQTIFDRNISAGVITAVKNRNGESLAVIRDAILRKEKDDAAGLLVRSHRLLGRKMREAEKGKETIRVGELTAISREMFNQTKAEKEAEAVAAQQIDPKEKIKQLQELLDENDEIRLERIVFAKRDTDKQTLPTDHDTSPERGDIS